MHIKKIDDSKVDEIIKMTDKEEFRGHSDIKPETPKDGAASNANGRQTLSTIAILILLALSLVQSIELINLKTQIQKAQFGSPVGAPAINASQSLPAQQGGC